MAAAAAHREAAASGPVAVGEHASVEVHDGELRVTIAVPFELSSLADAQLDLSECLVLLRGPPGTGGCIVGPEVRVPLPEGFVLDASRASAKYSRKRRQLTVSSPLGSGVLVPAGAAAAAAAAAVPTPAVPAASTASGGAAAALPPAAAPPAAPAAAFVPAPRPAAVPPAPAVLAPTAAALGGAGGAEAEEDDDDEVPCLEAARSFQPQQAMVGGSASSAAAAVQAHGSLAKSETNDAAQEMMETALTLREQKRKETEEARRQSDLSSGGGLKKGFLSSAKPAKKKAPAASSRPSVGGAERAAVQGEAEDVPYIGFAGGDAESARKESLKLPEVQAAIRQGSEMLQKDQSWITPQLMAAMQTRPDLLAGLSNPRMQQAMQLMQSDPLEAKRRFGNDPEVTKFLQDFSSLMATHFDVLGTQAPGTSKGSGPAGGSGGAVAAALARRAVEPSPLVELLPPGAGRGAAGSGRSGNSSSSTTPFYTGNLAPDDPLAVALSDPKVADAFQDAEVQMLIEELRAGKQLEMQHLYREKPHLFRKVKILLDAKLLGMAS